MLIVSTALLALFAGLVVLTALRWPRGTGRLAGCTGIVDRDAQRIAAELRAIAGTGERR